MSKANRVKGRRVEYLLRDHARALGFTAHRVPMSGAAQGFKGDIILTNKEAQVVLEVKSRKDEFKDIYAWYENVCTDDLEFFETLFIDNTKVKVTNDLNRALNEKGWCWNVTDSKVARKLIKLQKYIKDCHILVLKQDRKDFLFITYEAIQ